MKRSAGPFTRPAYSLPMPIASSPLATAGDTVDFSLASLRGRRARRLPLAAPWREKA